MTRFLRHVLALLATLFALSAAAGALPTSPIVGMRVLEDPGGALALDEALGSPGWKTIPPGPLTRGFSSSAWWIELTVRTPRDDGGTWLLRVTPSYLDEIVLRGPEVVRATGSHVAASTLPVRVSGDHRSFREREIADRGFAFALDLPPGEDARLWLRVRSSSTLMVFPSVMRQRDALVQGTLDGLMTGAHLSMLAVIGLAALGAAAAWRKRMLFWFGLSQLANFAFTFASNGYIAQWFAPDEPEIGHYANGITLLLAIAAGALFSRALFARYASPRWFDLMTWTGVACLPIGLSGLAMGLDREVTLMANAWVLASVPMMPLRSLTIDEPSVRRWMMFGACSFYALWLGLYMLIVFGLITPTRQILLTHLLLNACVTLLFAAKVSIAEARRRAEEVQLQDEVEDARRRAAWERDARMQQGVFLSMLAHEVKTPLAVVRTALASLRSLVVARELTREDRVSARFERIDRAACDIDALVERCLAVERFDSDASTLDERAFRIHDLLAAVSDACSAPARIRCDAPGLPLLRGDVQLLRIAVGNLVDNALKYGAPERDVGVRVGIVPGEIPGASPDAGAIATGAPAARAAFVRLRIEVENEPIDGRTLDGSRLFRKFQRGEHAQEISGAGLGLHLVRGIAERMGGTASCEASPERTIFRLEVVLSRSVSAASETRARGDAIAA